MINTENDRSKLRELGKSREYRRTSVLIPSFKQKLQIENIQENKIFDKNSEISDAYNGKIQITTPSKRPIIKPRTTNVQLMSI